MNKDSIIKFSVCNYTLNSQLMYLLPTERGHEFIRVCMIDLINQLIYDLDESLRTPQKRQNW